MSSFIQRQIFKITNDPEAEKLYQEKLKEDRAAREEFIAKLEADLRSYEKLKTSEAILEDDYNFVVKFLRDEISRIRGSSMTTNDIIMFEDSKPYQDYLILKENNRVRFTVYYFFEDIVVKSENAVRILKEKKQTVSPIFKELQDIAKIQQNYIIKNRFLDKYKYDEIQKEFEEKRKELEEKYEIQTKSSNVQELEKAAIAKNNEKRQEFSVWDAVGEALGIAGIIILSFALIVFGLFGASLATNLNIYKNGYFRTLYAIYGFIFFFVVIPYVLGYRWWWNGMKPRFYSFIPLVPYKFENRWAQLLLSWMSFKPEDSIDNLEEWN
jgi:lipopolysaccharide export LptBFGC system permease protein LptF